MSAGDSSHLVTTSTPDLGAYNGSIISPSSKEQTSHGSVSGRSSGNGGFSSSSTSTVISVLKPVATEDIKSLISFGGTAVTSSVNATSHAPADVTSDSVTGSVFEVNSSHVNAGLLCSPAVSAPSHVSSPAAVSLFGSAKSDGGPSTTTIQPRIGRFPPFSTPTDDFYNTSVANGGIFGGSGSSVQSPQLRRGGSLFSSFGDGMFGFLSSPIPGPLCSEFLRDHTTTRHMLNGKFYFSIIVVMYFICPQMTLTTN
jgi:hypothetical protein